ncbi:S8 family serine peptidase [Jiangella rhizosphaerae]|uniref:Peptidase S8/S53 subtilisin kexin sedolisin n=1 Tax=Jiangella rhizosphaerae TaxID=2293569 RepID=A0A418KIF1_9ACTN|nr:S8 family serine peptidase [Jiangella rhizosphaerae]RIQ12955.1 peptidase S8/S53 subtilisin kexin sedolisin [Jiangella rhizosphaerae]
MPRTILSWHRTRARLLVPAAATALLIGAGGTAPAGPAVSAPSDAAASAVPAVPATGSAATGRTYQVTLLTGDVVILHVAPDGRQAAWAESTPSGRAPAFVERDGHVLALPDQAVPYVQDGVLDERLFDLTYLAESGYHDLARDDLPLLVSAPDGPGIRSVPEAPSGTRAERSLPSIGALAVTAAKDELGSVWDDVRAGTIGRVWLNGRVEATLAESVPQIGAPEAWEQGLDGTGSTVAVLDTGWDPAHPDLAGQVAGARNFTEDADPEGQVAVDRQGHGTHVAATVAGTGAASGGTHPGVAPGADLLIGKVLGDDGSGYEDWIIAGMEWAVAQGADVVSMSLGTDWASDGTDPMSLAVDRLSAESDTLFVIAAGNTGPFEGTVGSPGAATSALTVGAVDKQDRPAAFSSRGPRIGDGAVKPEVVAPGVGIVAARAAGTSLGSLLDEHYTSLNGTSMATPHVAGAAAILAQQHPDWDDEQLKQRLITSSTPLDEPVSFQGAGRVDVAAAVGETVSVDQGVVDFGQLAQDAPVVSRTLTYHNPTDRRVTLRISADVTRPGGSQGRPAMRVRNPVLSIPPGGSASTRVEVSAESSTGGSYSGRIVAQDPRDRDTAIHSVTTFTVERPLHTVSVDTIGRDGEPAGGHVDLWNTETGEWTRAFVSEGTATAVVPEGTYTVVTTIETAGRDFAAASYALAAEPDLRVDEDVTLAYDARDAEQVRVTTPREADETGFDAMWERAVGEQSIRMTVAQGFDGADLYTLPSRRPKAGTFELSTTWQLVQPLLEVRAGGERLLPSPRLATPPLVYTGPEALPLVDVGTGTAAEFAAADVAGKAVLVSRHGEWEVPEEQLRLATEAGAALLLLANDVDGEWSQFFWGATLPAYTVDQAAGERLRAALAADPGLELDLTSRRDSEYSYHLAFTENGLPGGVTYAADADDLAVVESDYRQASERMGRREAWIPFAGASSLGSSMSIIRNGPVHRTEYLSADGVEWQRFAQPHPEFANMYWTWSGIEPYAAGSTTEQVWWGPLVAPGMPALTGSEEYGLPVARFRDAIRISLPQYLYGPSTYGFIQQQLGDSSELVLRRDGVEVGRSTWSEAQFTVPGEAADFELSLETSAGAGNFSDLWTHTATTWGFRSARAADREVLPLIQLAYGLETGLYDEVPAGASYPVELRPSYPAGATGPGGFTATAEVSFDDGASWRPLAVTASGDGGLQATVPAADGGFASLRVTVTDAAGNTVRQQIDRAWRVGTAG